MSGDLISRKTLVSNLKLFLDRSFLGETTAHNCISVGEIAGLIKDEPTAYDADKVIEQLENAKTHFIGMGTIQSAYFDKGIDKAIEIVKSGGVTND